MAATTRPQLRIYPGDAALPGAPEATPVETADRLYHREAFRKPSRSETLEPYSRAWFERIESLRYARQGRWLPQSLGFARHRGDTVLGIGEGLGTDWLQYALNGANVVTLSPSQEQLDLIRTHFEIRGLSARTMHGTPHCLPLPADSIDVACVQGLLHEVDEPARVIDELYRVLRPGGKVMVVAPAKFNAQYWYDVGYPWRQWLPDEKADPVPGAGTAKQLRQSFGQFVEHRVSKRHLRRGELPHLWRFLPLSLMERLVGNLLVMKAFKPVSAAIAARAAA